MFNQKQVNVTWFVCMFMNIVTYATHVTYTCEIPRNTYSQTSTI